MDEIKITPLGKKTIYENCFLYLKYIGEKRGQPVFCDTNNSLLIGINYSDIRDYNYINIGDCVILKTNNQMNIDDGNIGIYRAKFYKSSFSVNIEIVKNIGNRSLTFDQNFMLNFA